MWNFERLPTTEHNAVIKALAEFDFKLLITLHNKYKLSANNYCCGSGESVYNWFKYGVEEQLIWITEEK